MKISYNWLRQYLKNLPPPEALADKLTMAGFEVEGIEALGRGVKGVVVAQILSSEKHPNADRLKLCKVKTDKGVHSIVCGATNMKVGDKVALALPGATLPEGIRIEKTKIRGVESEGMLCSEAELGLQGASEGIMILPEELQSGRDFTSSMDLDDHVFNINVMPNRPDCLSVLGIAREVAAITGSSVRSKKPEARSKKKIPPFASCLLPLVSIKEPSLCRRYAARIIENVVIGPSPRWLRHRLESHGFRSINNIVDVTNYVMLEYGQPLHAFDYNRIYGRQIVVRRGRQDERIKTLDGAERTLSGEMLVIADRESPVALAGIMGGSGTETSNTTKNILLESAYFEPSCVRRTSKKLGLSTESSYRFERGTDIEGVKNALDRAAQMITELTGGNIAGAVDKYPRPYKPVSVGVRLSRINRLLGVTIGKNVAEGYFKRLSIGFKQRRVKREAGIVWDIIPPPYRVDLLKETDIIEEVARLHGYEKIPTTLPVAKLSTTQLSGICLMRERARNILADNGLLEAINYSFISPKFFGITKSDAEAGLKLLNPLTEEQAVMRQSLIPGLLQTLQYNLNHDNRDVRIFEIGRIFIPVKKGVEEKELIGGLISGLRYGDSWNNARGFADFYDIKGILEQLLSGLGVRGYAFVLQADIPFLHPGKAVAVNAGSATVGMAGEIHPDIRLKLDIKQAAYAFELDTGAVMGYVDVHRRYAPLPRYPAAIRDAAIIADRAVTYQELYDAIRGFGMKTLEEICVFDVYYGENIPADKYSIAIRFVYRSPERTLTDEDINADHTAILQNLRDRFGIEVRGEGT